MLSPNSSYRFPELMKFFSARRTTYHTNPQMIDDVIYTPYVYDPPNQLSDSGNATKSKPLTGDLLGISELAIPEDATRPKHRSTDIFETPTEAEIFIFEYGTVVIWGMSEAEEKRFLSSLFVHSFPDCDHIFTMSSNRKRFEIERLGRPQAILQDCTFA